MIDSESDLSRFVFRGESSHSPCKTGVAGRKPIYSLRQHVRSQLAISHSQKLC